MKLNPIILKESKIKMRTWKAPAIIFLYLALLGSISLIVLSQTLYSVNFDRYSVQTFFFTTAISQYCMICFIVPALTSSSISGERERQTLDLLLCTKLKPSSIIIGKLITSISHVFMLVIASMPIYSLLFLFGGFSFFTLLKILLSYIVVSILIGSFGVFYSTLLKKSITSTVVTYLTVLFIMLGTFFISLLYISLTYGYSGASRYNDIGFWLMYLNPGSGFVSMLINEIGQYSDLTEIGIQNNLTAYWLINLAISMVVSFVLLLVSSRILSPVKAHSKKRGA